MNKLLTLILISMVWFSCSQKDESVIQQMPVNDTTEIENDRAIRFLALGDSYTIGESVEAHLRWPLQLAEKLKTSGYSTEVEIIAMTGWTTGQLAEAIQSQDPEGPYDLVSLLIGVNNQFRGLDTADYRFEFRWLLQEAISLAGGDTDRVFVLSIPDYSVTPFARNMDTAKISREIDVFNTINFEETLKESVVYIDVTPISRHAKIDSALLADDSLHPSGTMYSAWVDLLRADALRLLQP